MNPHDIGNDQTAKVSIAGVRDPVQAFHDARERAEAAMMTAAQEQRPSDPSEPPEDDVYRLYVWGNPWWWVMIGCLVFWLLVSLAA